MTSHFDLIPPPSGGGVSSSPLTRRLACAEGSQKRISLRGSWISSVQIVKAMAISHSGGLLGAARLIPSIPICGIWAWEPLSLHHRQRPTKPRHNLKPPATPWYSRCASQEAQILLGFFFSFFLFRGLPVGEVTQLMLVLVRVNWFARDFSSSGRLLGASLNISLLSLYQVNHLSLCSPDWLQRQGSRYAGEPPRPAAGWGLALWPDAMSGFPVRRCAPWTRA